MCAILRILLIFIVTSSLSSLLINIARRMHIVERAFFTLHNAHSTRDKGALLSIVFGSPHLSRRGYNNSEYYYDRRKSAAAMAYLAAAAPTPL